MADGAGATCVYSTVVPAATTHGVGVEFGEFGEFNDFSEFSDFRFSLVRCRSGRDAFMGGSCRFNAKVGMNIAPPPPENKANNKAKTARWWRALSLAIACPSGRLECLECLERRAPGRVTP
jgi:hypothetical protein